MTQQRKECLKDIVFSALRAKRESASAQAAVLSGAGVFRAGAHAVAYEIWRSARRRRSVSFAMMADGKLKIMAPHSARRSFLEALLVRRTQWIVARYDAVRTFENLPENEALFLGRRYALKILHDNEKRRGCIFDGSAFFINLSYGVDDVRESRTELVLWYKRKARAVFRDKVAQWSRKQGIVCGAIRLSNAAKRWGSCSVRNVVRLNWRLVLLPEALLDYVIVHELCHVVHKHHGPAFWRAVAEVMPDHKAHNVALKKHSAILQRFR